MLPKSDEKYVIDPKEESREKEAVLKGKKVLGGVVGEYCERVDRQNLGRIKEKIVEEEISHRRPAALEVRLSQLKKL